MTTDAGDRTNRSPMPVPPLLNDLAGWAWRILILFVLVTGVLGLMNVFYFITLPFFAALFATALA